MVYMPRLAPIVVLMFLGTVFLLGICGLVFLYGLVRRKRKVALGAFLCGAGITTIYLGVLFLVSLASQERVLAAGEEKYFCEADCHEAFSIADVQRMAGTAPEMVRYAVRVNVWFDKNTISATRPLDVPLYPNARTAYIVDTAGRKYFPAGSPTGYVSEFARPIRPGESFSVDLAFDVPASATHPRLYITTADLPTLFLIGHENSLFHARVMFALPPASIPGAAKPS